MNTQQRLRLRAADAIHQAVRRLARRPAFFLPEAAWEACRRLVRLIDKAKQRGWTRASQKVQQRLSPQAAECIDELVQGRTQLEHVPSATRILNEREIFADLLALDDEFEEVQIDVRKSTVWANTDRIVLRDIDLGPFRIVLDWSILSHHRPYGVTALDPNPAASSAGTTHPHVRDNHLCEGDGRAPIRKALREGRVLDFFVLVRQVLETYSPDTAYVRLRDWGGRDCSDCGSTVSEDDCVSCGRCGNELCPDCATSCTSCSEYFCSSHISNCPSCDDPYCRRCLTVCGGCGNKFCKECLDDQKCPSCRRRDEDVCECEAEAEEPEAADAEGSAAAVHPLRLGQAAVSA
jgi:hypothetical protein